MSNSRLKAYLAHGSIRLTLLVSFLVVTAALLIPTLSFNALNINISNQYQTTLDNMIMEYKVADASSRIVTSYSDLVQQPNDPKLLATHTDSIKDMNTALTSLDKTITFEASRTIYKRILNTSQLLTEYVERGLKNIKARNFSQSGEILEQITRSAVSIQDDTASLVLKDLSQSAVQQKQLQRTQSLVGILGAALILVVTAGCIAFAIMFSARISRPLIKLAQLAGTIANGDLKTDVQPELLVRGDEIGSLSNSFNTMLQKLKAKITELNKANANVEQKVKELQIEKNIAETERAKDEAILSSIGEGVIATDNTGKVLIMNTIAEDILELGHGANVGKALTSLFTLFDEDGSIIPAEEHPLYMTIKQGQKFTETFSFKKKDGKSISLNITSTPVAQQSTGKKETIVGTINIIRDITKEKEVDRMKTEFISLASHQLRTPLSAIKWFSEMLVAGDAGKLNKDQTEFAQNIAESTERMIDLVNSLLNISRMESGRIMIDPKETDLKDMIGDIVVDLQAKIKERDQNLIVSVTDSLPKIMIDPKLIGQVYLNLLTNAIKYTPKGGEISVFVSKKDDQIISQVTDNGYGIPISEQGKMFQKFFRATNIVKVETDGTGLGMYLIKAIVEESQGKIWFKSEEGKGTTFWFSIPLSGMKAKKGEVTLGE